jgi:tetratricopeptide (TPR) repeat protein
MAILAGCASDPRPPQLDLGERAINANPPQYDVALRNADAVLRMDAPQAQAEAHYLRGLAIENRVKPSAFVAGNDMNAARTEYQIALTGRPTLPVEARVHSQLGNIAYWQDDYATALREWTVAFGQLERLDSKSWILYRMGICQQRLGRFADADATFARVQQLYPRTEPAQRSAARQGVRGFYVQMGAFAQAADAQKAVAAVESVGLVPMKATDGGLTVIRTSAIPTYAQATALRARLAAQYPGAQVGP